MNQGVTENFVESVQSYDIKGLANITFDLRKEFFRLKSQMDYCEAILVRKMEDIGAVRTETEFVRADINYPMEYDSEILQRLLDDEVVQQRLLDNGGWVPEHIETVTVPEKFNATHIKPLAREGKKFADIIEEAYKPKLDVRTKIKFTAKNPKPVI
tara:strand:+ start:563 stop:1030 length:468 start_codon:yes stop_codon:yes gene_type:complete